MAGISVAQRAACGRWREGSGGFRPARFRFRRKPIRDGHRYVAVPLVWETSWRWWMPGAAK